MADLSLDSRRAEKSKISAIWIERIRRIMSDGDLPSILDEALARAEISPHDLATRQNIEQHQLDLVTEYVLPYVPDITLRMLAGASLTDLGVIGYAAINSDTVGRALRFLLRYHDLTSDRFSDRLEVAGETAVITPVPVLSHLRDLRNIGEDSLTGNWRTLELLLGESVTFREASLHFAYPAPSYEQSYRQVFNCKIVFDADRTEMRFPAAWLEKPVETANQAMADVCRAMCERLLGGGESSRAITQMVRRLLLSRPGRRMYRLEEAAAELSLSTNQLRKRLYKSGTSYKRLVLEIRMALAQHYLSSTDLPIQEIAYLLDYSSSAPFSRAFKAQVGLPPEEFREADTVTET